ncbi:MULTISPECIES: TolC family protein [Pseudomonas]|uniref:TolC family protein n=1 Tax=Pseudomonas TaxID=286 RepID=UPI0005BE98B1|nr:hypothetical protein HMPREF3289_21875 [Pseudomonas sp. HMSC75E02]WBG61660.1 TolC family protein [Pseudomonas citronellolis]
MTDTRRTCAPALALCVALSLSTSIQATTLLNPSRASMSLRSETVSLLEQRVELTLSDVVYLGLRNNRSIRSAYLERIAQRFELRVEADRFNPRLVLTSRHLANRNHADRYRQTEIFPQTSVLTEYGTRFSLAWRNQLTLADQAGRTANDGADFSFIQPLLRGAGRDIVGAPLRMARLGEQLNKLNLKATVSDTVTQMIMAYREILRAQEQLEIAKDALERSRQLMDSNRALIAAGRMAEFEIVQAEADAATQELAVEDVANQLETNRLELLRLLALDLNLQIRAVDTLDAQPVTIGLAEALVIAQRQQPAYLSQLIASEQAAIQLNVSRNQRLWDLSLVGGATQVRDHYPTPHGRAIDRTWEGYAGIQIEIPIGDLSRRQAEVRAQVAVENQAIRLTEARQMLERDVGDAVRNLGTRWRQYEIAQRARDLSRRKLDIEREKFQAGRSSNFQVLSFEADLRSAESASLNALIAYLNTQTTLDQMLGTTLESWDIALND